MDTEESEEVTSSFLVSSFLFDRHQIFGKEFTPIGLSPFLVIYPFLEGVCPSGKMDGWMCCDFTCFSTVFQSYQNDGRLIMKALCNEPRLWMRIFRLEGDRTRSAGSVGQGLTH